MAVVHVQPKEEDYGPDHSGRPDGYVKFDRERRARYLALRRAGVTCRKAARAAGVSINTVLKHRREDPWFAQREEEAIAEAVEEVEAALYDAAVSGNVRAQIFFLVNSAPDRYKFGPGTPAAAATVNMPVTATVQQIAMDPVALRDQIRAQAIEARAELEQLVPQ